MKPVFGVVADDLTGGMETAAMLVAQGVDCGFVTDPAALAQEPERPAYVVAQKTRVIAADLAVAKMEAGARALLDRGARQLFFKYCATFDSTDQGNIGPVADMLLRVAGADRTAFCPGSPELLRTVYSGHLFLGTQLVSESPKRHDPLTPMTDPDLVRVLQRQSKTGVGLLHYPLLRAGAEALEAAIARQMAEGKQFFIIDSVTNDDLATIARLTRDWKVMTGNATIVQYYPPLWKALGLVATDAAVTSLPPVRGGGMVLSGSCADRTLEQLAAFEAARPVLRLDLLSTPDAASAINEAMNWALPRLNEGPVAIATSASPEAVRAAQDRYGRDGAAALAEAILGGLALALKQAGVRRFVVAGGETSGSIVEHLGVKRLRVGAYGGPGIGNAVTDGVEPMGFCLKSGKLGPVDLFLSALHSMEYPGGAA